MSLTATIKSKFWNIKDDGYEILYNRSEKPFEKEPTNFSDDRLNAAIKHHNQKWFHNEIVVRVENATVEPRYGYAIDGLNTIIGASIRTRENLPSPVPSIQSYFLGANQKLEKAILFDGSMGVNYFHLISDVLHKIYLLEGFTELNCPILVGTAVWTKPFFQFLINNTDLKRHNWVKINEPIIVGELFISRPLPYDKKYWNRTKGLFIKSDHRESSKALFINRTGTRHITNFNSIKPILEKHKVEIVDPGNSSMQVQAELFNSASHIIGIHGAGLTNVMFCDHSNTRVLELCSNNRIGTQYYWLCATLGIDWDMVLGGTANSDQSFELDPALFEERLTTFLAS